MKIWIRNYSKVTSLVSSILFLILGAVMYTKPDVLILIFSYVIGGLLILSGLYNCIKNYTQLRKDNNTSSRDMVLGITLIVFGLVFVFLASVIEAVVRLLIGGWILFIGINRLTNSLYITPKKSKFFINLIISILLISGGLYTILEANLAFQAIGIVMIIYSSLEIITCILNRNNTVVTKKSSEIEEAIVVKND